MAVSKIIDRLTLGTWLKTNIDDFNSCYVIAIKGTKNKADTIDVDKVSRISFELGIDSGIKNEPLPIGRVNIGFKDVSTVSDSLKGKIGGALASRIPSEFYIRATSVDVDMREVKSGTVSISVNLNSLKLD